MYHLYYPERDTTLYERYPAKNTGIDPILDLIKHASGSLFERQIQSANYNSRFLLDFGSQITAIANAVASNELPPIGPLSQNSASVYLNLRIANATDLPINYTLYAFPVSESWNNGNGTFDYKPEISNGASWYYRDNNTQATHWNTGSAHSKNDYSNNVSLGGGTWITGSGFEASQSFSYEEPDVRMDVTNIVKQWVKGIIPNYGFIIKRSRTDENSSDILGSLKFFGLDTHTIYVPRLEVAWNDTVLTGTGSRPEVTSNIYIPYITNIRNEYRENERAIFRIGARPEFVTKTYATSSNYLVEYRLPTSSYYSIQDSVTMETIIPFDTNATQISCDNNGSFFKLRLNTFQPERYYKIILRVERDGGNDIQTFGEGFYFKVVR
jgi:hypothetical protein